MASASSTGFQSYQTYCWYEESICLVFVLAYISSTQPVSAYYIYHISTVAVFALFILAEYFPIWDGPAFLMHFLFMNLHHPESMEQAVFMHWRVCCLIQTPLLASAIDRQQMRKLSWIWGITRTVSAVARPCCPLTTRSSTILDPRSPETFSSSQPEHTPPSPLSHHLHLPPTPNTSRGIFSTRYMIKIKLFPPFPCDR